MLPHPHRMLEQLRGTVAALCTLPAGVTVENHRRALRIQAVVSLVALLVLGGYSLVPYGDPMGWDPNDNVVRTILMGVLVGGDVLITLAMLLSWAADGESLRTPLYVAAPGAVILFTYFMPKEALAIWSPILITVLGLIVVAAVGRCYMFESGYADAYYRARGRRAQRLEDRRVELFDSDAATLAGSDEGDLRKPEDEERLLGNMERV